MGQRNVPNEYEQLRIKRMQENSRKLQELGLENAKDAFAVKKSSPKPKVSKLLQISQQKDDTAERRRSSRVAALPALNYEDKDTLNLRGQRRCKPAGEKKKRGIPASSAAMEWACETAEKIDCKFPSIVKQMMPSHVAGGFWLVVNAAKVLETSFKPGNPSLVRMMMPSHVSSCFWMGLPRGFCAAHMPGQDTDMTLVDEEGGQWESRYLAHKNGLSGGWRGFALDHSLEYGDVVIFELIKPTTIKIHIVRVADHESGGGASQSKSQKQAKRKTGTRYENVPVQGRGKRAKIEQSDSENEDVDEDDEEEDEYEEEEEAVVPIQDDSSSDDSTSSESDSTSSESDSDSDSESESESENDEAQVTDIQKKYNASVRLPVKPEVGSESGSGSADDNHVERPILLEDEEESHVQKRTSTTQQQQKSVASKPVASSATRRKKPQAVRGFDKVKKAPAMPKVDTLSSEKESSAPTRLVKPPLPGGRPPKPSAVRRLTNVMKSRKIQVNSETARTDRKAGKQALSKQRAG